MAAPSSRLRARSRPDPSVRRVRSRRRRAAVGGGVALLAGLVACSEPPVSGPAPAQRVVLVSFDTTRADRIGAYGAARARTPHLDALAARGVRFAHAISPTPLTQPSHATLFTGLDPPAHGLRHNGVFTLQPDLPTLADTLRSAGFATAGFVGSLVMGSDFGLGRGFDVYDDRVEPRGEAVATGASERNAGAVVDAALAWLRDAPDRFLLFAHFFDPHAPYRAPSRWTRFWAASPYDAEITYADAQLGRLLAAVDARFPDGRTLVVVTGDHGESLGEHGEETHAYGIYDSTQRIPLLLAGPGVASGGVVDAVVRLADVAPTVLALLDAGALPGAAGRDLRAAWDPDQTLAPAAAYVETLATHFDFGWSPLHGLRTATHKYVRAPRPELYDMTVDPGEERDIAAIEPERVAELDRQLAAYLAGMPDALTPTAVDDATRRQLQSLGYVVPETVEAPAPGGAVGGPDPKDHIETASALNRAHTAIDAGKPEQALAALEGHPASPLVALYRSEAARLAGRPAEAERIARAAIRDGAERDLLYLRLGSALLEQGKLQQAQRAFARAAELNPGSPEPQFALGLIAEQRGQRERAERHYRRALDGALFLPDARWALAALLFETERAAEADALLAELAPTQLAEPRAAARLAVAESRAGRGEAARARLERALAAHPDSPALLRARQQLR